MSVTLRHLAELVRGEVIGDADTCIDAARTLSEAEAGDITFVEDERHSAALLKCRATAAVVPESITAQGLPVIRVPDALLAFAEIVRHLHGHSEPEVHGIDPLATIHSTAAVGADASIHAFAAIGQYSVIGARCRIHSGVVIGRNCRVGDDVVLFPNVVLYDDTIIGDRVIIHANSVIGADGFGYRLRDGRHVKVPQLGSVEIGDDVEVGACTTIDRGTFQTTRIGAGTKIDNLVQVAHNCSVGKHNLFVSQMGMAGSSSTGDYVVVAGQVGIVGHVRIGDRVIIGAQAGVTKDVPAGQQMLGSPATPVHEQKRILVTLERLPEIRRELRRIKQHLGLSDEAAA